MVPQRIANAADLVIAAGGLFPCEALATKVPPHIGQYQKGYCFHVGLQIIDPVPGAC